MSKTRPKPTAKQRTATAAFVGSLKQFEWDMHCRVMMSGRLPREWREIWEARASAASKTHVSFRVDDDVLRFFKSMGPGYGPRMNNVLRTFMLARLGGLIEEADLPEEYRERWMGRPRPSLAQITVEHYGTMGMDPDEETDLF